mgnify:CR=1 FL=1
MSIFVDSIANKGCYNPFESYGMICVRCGCCSEDEKVRYTSRIALHKRLLQDVLAKSRTAVHDIVRRNFEIDIAWNRERIAEYEAKLKEIDRENAVLKSP